MKLEVGMYVRTRFGISKIIEDGNVKVIKSDNEETYDVDKNGRQYPTQFRDYVWTSDVIKASHNIIDLIEVGDFVNKELVYERTGSKIYLNGDTGEIMLYSDGTADEDIRSIVTKEQFEKMIYEVNIKGLD
jgi:hypothetical protein